eukprot:Em0019g274a
MQLEGTSGYGMLLMQIADGATVDMRLRLAAAINFKNFVKRNWRIVEDQPNKISSEDREFIKRTIVGLMLKNPESIQRQLSDAITIIGQEDFPGNWKDLIPEMVSHFRSGDFYQINGVLRTAHSLTKRYRHEFQSQQLWAEIKIVLESFAAPLTELFHSTIQLVPQHAQNSQALQVLFNSLLLIAKVFHSLTAQDLPDQFADKNLEPWMNHFHDLLTTDNKLVESDDDTEPGSLELLKSQICETVAMFAQKYDEDFSGYLPKFVQAIWNLLVTTDIKPKHDGLVSNALEFLASVSERPAYKDLFANPSTLQSICEKVILPNLQFREADEELFEDNPEEYVHRDLEGSDVGTRRHSACNLNYAENPVGNWRSKDSALYLIAAIATRSKTTKHGATKTSELVNVADIFQSQCLPDLHRAAVNEQPVLKADAIRYVVTFRSVLPRDILVGVVPLMGIHLTSSSHVVHTYAAHCLEKLLVLRDSAGSLVMRPEDIKPHFEGLLVNLFAALKFETSQQNEYVMKAILRSMSTMKDNLVPYSEILLKELSTKLAAVSLNPTKPHFNHYLFESICCIIRYTGKADNKIETFEAALFPIIESILVRDVSEFVPYVFQILSLMLELRPSPIPPPYMVIFPLLLTPALWERTGNIAALVRLLRAFIEKCPAIISGDKLSAVLGVFQKLIASKTNDHEGFYLIETLIESIKQVDLAPFIKNIFVILFQRPAEQQDRVALVELVDSIQPKLFGMVVEKLFIPDVQKVGGQVERRICAVGITKMLTETPAMLSEPYVLLWAPLLQTLVKLFELPEDSTIPEDEHFVEIEDTPGYQASYSQLMFAGVKEHDPFAGYAPDTKKHLAQCLHQLSSKEPGKLQTLISSGLSSDVLQYLQAYMQSANIPTLL